jgi:hypothetical protein
MNYALDDSLDTIMDGRSIVSLITADGGIAQIHFHMGRIHATVYTEQVKSFSFTPDFWRTLGRSYVKTFDDGTTHEQVIGWCLEYLCLFCDKYERVDFETLATDYNNRADVYDEYDAIIKRVEDGDKLSAQCMYDTLTDEQKAELLNYVETLKHFECENCEQIEQYLNNLLISLQP